MKFLCLFFVFTFFSMDALSSDINCSEQNCASVQMMRKGRVPSVCENIFSPFFKVFQAQNKKNQFVQCLRSYQKQTEDLRSQDLQKLSYYLRNKSLTLDELKTWLNPEGPLTRHLQVIKHNYSYPDEDDRSAYKRYSMFGPFREFIEAYTGEKGSHAELTQVNQTSSPSTVTVIRYNKNILDELQERIRKPNTNLIPLLLARAIEAPNISFSKDRHALTPYMAKFILFETLRQRLSTEKFLELVNQLKLKFNFAQPNDEIIELANVNATTIHNGYFYGASRDLGRRLFDSNSRSSAGIDCSALIEDCARISHPNLKSGMRFSTGRLLAIIQDKYEDYGISHEYAHEVKETFDFQPLECESQLNVGDAILFKGHVFLFNGYIKTETGKYLPHTIEASGNENREIGEYIRTFYDDDQCRQMKFYQSEANQPQAYILRVKNL